MASEIESGERALLGLQLPFTRKPFATIGAGSKTAAQLAEAVGYSFPVRAYRHLMSGDKMVGSFLDARWQKAADRAMNDIAGPYADAMANARMPWMEGYTKFQQTYDNIAADLAKQGDPIPFTDLTRDLLTNLEGVPDPGAVAAKMRQYLEATGGQLTPEHLQSIGAAAQEYHGFVQGIDNSIASMHAAMSVEGLPIKTWTGQYEKYGTRQAADVIRAGRNKILAGLSDAQKAKYNFYEMRRAWLNDLPNSSVLGNRAARDMLLRGIEEEADPITGAISHVRIKDADHVTQLQDALTQMGIPFDPRMSRKELQVVYFRHKYIEPGAG